MLPRARHDGLTTKKLGDELVVFDGDTKAVHSLNRVAELVWRACDGRTDVDALTRIANRATGQPDTRPAVELALEQLSRRGLIDIEVARPAAERRSARRDALRQLATALAVPMIVTLTASRARAQVRSQLPCSITCPPGSLSAVVLGITDALGQCVAFIPCTPSPTTGGTGCSPNGATCTTATGLPGVCQNGVCVPSQGT
jgi:hypothetical protein